MKKNLFAGIDQGTSGTKGVLIDENGRELFHTVVSVSLEDKGPNSVEQNGGEILSSVNSVLNRLKNKALEIGVKIENVGLSCQRSGVLAWDKATGTPLSPILTWADQRMSATLETLKNLFTVIEDKTCLPVHPGFAAPKIAHLQKKFSSPSVHVGTLDSFICYNLVKPSCFVTDDSMASRTLLYNPRQHSYDAELLKIFGVDKERLPEIVPSFRNSGEIDGITFSALVADQQASLIGRRSKDRKTLLNLGSILSLLIDTGKALDVRTGFSSNVLFSYLEDQSREFAHTLEGTSPACAGIVRWAKNIIGEVDTRSFDEYCGVEIPTDDTFPVCYFPKGGTGSPTWKGESAPLVEGWDGKDKGALARASLENIAGFIMESIREIVPSNESSLMVSGGLSKSEYLMRFLSDVSGKTLLLSDSPNASARGAALLSAGDVSGNLNEELIFERIVPQNSKASKRLDAWRDLKDRVKT